MPRVSVIVPNYNHEQFLQRRLDTIFNQTFQDFEVLLLDDCSTDGSRAIIEHYQVDPRVKVVLNTSNSGSPFKQWNKGFNLGQGEYIWIAESDDYAAPEFLETLVAKLDADARLGLVYCQSWMTNADQAGTPRVRVKKWYEGLPNHERWLKGFQNAGAAELAQYMVFKNTIPNASAVVFRRSLLEGGLRAREDMRLAGDWMFWVELLLRSNLAYVPEPLNYFRIAHKKSQRNRMGKEGLHMLEGLEVYSRIASAVPVSEEIRFAALKHQVKMWGFFAYTRRLTMATNQQIYRKLLDQHPEAALHRFRQIMLPFAYYFTTGPFRRNSIFRVPITALISLFLWLARKRSADRPSQ
jgi:glycosyltransferase involved in cell wall biosynthesis